MGRGPGAVQTQLVAILARNHKKLFTTRELCCRVFGIAWVEKKHRVSVLRALKHLSAASKLNVWRAVLKNQRDDFWFNGDRAFRRAKPGRGVAQATRPRPRKGKTKRQGDPFRQPKMK